jgi:hypothetical protein
MTSKSANQRLADAHARVLAAKSALAAATAAAEKGRDFLEGRAGGAVANVGRVTGPLLKRA